MPFSQSSLRKEINPFASIYALFYFVVIGYFVRQVSSQSSTAVASENTCAEHFNSSLLTCLNEHYSPLARPEISQLDHNAISQPKTTKPNKVLLERSALFFKVIARLAKANKWPIAEEELALKAYDAVHLSSANEAWAETVLTILIKNSEFDLNLEAKESLDCFERGLFSMLTKKPAIYLSKLEELAQVKKNSLDQLKFASDNFNALVEKRQVQNQKWTNYRNNFIQGSSDMDLMKKYFDLQKEKKELQLKIERLTPNVPEELTQQSLQIEKEEAILLPKIEETQRAGVAYTNQYNQYRTEQLENNRQLKESGFKVHAKIQQVLKLKLTALQDLAAISDPKIVLSDEAIVQVQKYFLVAKEKSASDLRYLESLYKKAEEIASHVKEKLAANSHSAEKIQTQVKVETVSEVKPSLLDHAVNYLTNTMVIAALVMTAFAISCFSLLNKSENSKIKTQGNHHARNRKNRKKVITNVSIEEDSDDSKNELTLDDPDQTLRDWAMSKMEKAFTSVKNNIWLRSSSNNGSYTSAESHHSEGEIVRIPDNSAIAQKIIRQLTQVFNNSFMDMSIHFPIYIDMEPHFSNRMINIQISKIKINPKHNLLLADIGNILRTSFRNLLVNKNNDINLSRHGNLFMHNLPWFKSVDGLSKKDQKNLQSYIHQELQSLLNAKSSHQKISSMTSMMKVYAAGNSGVSPGVTFALAATGGKKLDPFTSGINRSGTDGGLEDWLCQGNGSNTKKSGQTQPASSTSRAKL